uniref:Uncharacterized protein n=1 Tax=Rhizophora mucronata TaxID=61149 RepID=A0A2P2PW60_RHIMU
MSTTTLIENCSMCQIHPSNYLLFSIKVFRHNIWP